MTLRSIVTLLLLSGPLVAAAEDHSADVTSIDAIVDAYYEVVSGPAGVVADVERDRFLHHPEHWVAIANVDAAGRPVIDVGDLDSYHGLEPQPRAEPFYERETDRVVQRFGNVAHVWSSYESARSPGGEPFDRGVNSIALWFDGDRWWIMNWMFDAAAEP
ncbi:MAG: hypothetical protein V2J24_11120 [Pseudomonadales bacterium]|jgi:hypothetical protein|nr:hypothetical protein [Pseudomonadales bacterium]